MEYVVNPIVNIGRKKIETISHYFNNVSERFLNNTLFYKNNFKRTRGSFLFQNLRTNYEQSSLSRKTKSQIFK